MSTTETVFGRIFVASQLERPVVALLEKWFPTYLREVERQVGWDLEPLESPASYSNRVRFDIEPGEPMPKAVVISPGLFETPQRGDGGDFYNASWQLAIGIAIAQRTEELADLTVKMYGAAVRAIMVQHQSIEGVANGVFWLDESYDDLEIPDKIQLYKAAAGLFSVSMEDVVTRWAGPVEPTEQAQLEEEVLTSEATIVKVPILDDI